MSKYIDLSKEELLQILENKDKELARKYGIFWDAEKIAEDVVTDCENNLPVLERVKDKKIKTDDTADNILIEGDNYHALTVLNYTHKEKIDVIYIDPPYNTGNKDFTYNDRYVDKEDGYRHSKWLNFMEKRLKLAKNLLTDKGVIFISIDDNEQAQLKLLCDWVFGEQNFIANLIWNQKTTGGHDATHINTVHEYVMCYAKDKSLLSLNKDVSNTEYTLFDEGKKQHFKWDSLWTVSHGYTANCDYPILAENGTEVYPWMCHKDREAVKNIARWFWSKETYELNKNELLVKKDRSGNYKVYKKVFATGEKPFQSLFAKEEVGGTSNGKKSLEDIFGSVKQFDNPKPISLIKKIIQIAGQSTSTILDFMAGSGTTGQAVLELNKEDGGNRQFILCTNNELNGVGSKLADEKRPENISEEEFENWKQQFGICQRVTYPRLEKVINGYNKNGTGDFVDGLGGNLQYYKTDFVKRVSNRDQIRFNLVNKCTEMLCVKEGIFEKYEEKTNYKIFISNDKKRFLCVYYNFTKFDVDQFVEEIGKLEGQKQVYIFSETKEPDLEPFRQIKDCVVEAIPEPIFEIYEELIKLNK